MSTLKRIGIMYFRRDLRLVDNTALNECVKENDFILPIFIFDPAQANKNKNKYHGISFILLQHFVHLLDITCQEKLLTKIAVFEGSPVTILSELVSHFKKMTVTVYFNMDYTPFSLQRDTGIFMSIENVKAYSDHLLTRQTEITNYKQLYDINPNDVYKKFTPFYNYYNAAPAQPKAINFKKIKSVSMGKGYNFAGMSTDMFAGMNRIDALKSVRRNIDYANLRDTPHDEEGIFHISHYLKFGIISIREAYYGFRQLTNRSARIAAIRQLYWRDFYTLIAWSNPKLLGWHFDGFDSKEQPKWMKLKKNSALDDKYNKISWRYDEKIINAWKKGITGFPIVDAGMRQLSQIGYMHNRARLITASFLTKICGIDWRIGEMWFAKNLIDYDPIINNGNWLWVAGGGADSQPYFRVFNPWLQQIAHDPDCIYIKKWVPELRDIDNKVIHTYYEQEKIKGYVEPIIDYLVEKEKTYQKYRAALH